MNRSLSFLSPRGRRRSVTLAGGLWLALHLSPALADLRIDDFRSGALDLRSRSCGVIDATRGGTMAGGTRRTRLIVTGPAANCAAQNPVGQPGTLQVRRNGPLVVGAGLKTFPRLELSYGQSLTNVTTPLNLNLAGRGYDRFRVSFTASDVPINFNLTLWTHLDEAAQSIASCSLNVLPGSSTYSVDLPFDRFTTGSPSAPDFRDVDFLFFVLQSASAVGANDFAVRSIVATRGALPGVPSCGN